ncbi:MAG: Trk system potassium uptake protein TrkG [Succiniclasticum sp.]|jgi:trk system potassium uptake protein
MRDYPVLRLMGIVGLILTAGMVPPLAYAFWKESYMILPFVGSAMVGLAFGAYALQRTKNRRKMRLSVRGGILFMGSAWFVMSLLCCLPYWASGRYTLLQALFESASALTTTGVSCIPEDLPYPSSLLIWHEIIQWLGSMAAMVLFSVIMPRMGATAAAIFSAEGQGVSAERTLPQLKEIVQFLIMLYSGLTLAETLCLMLTGLGPLTALRMAACTISSSGFIRDTDFVASQSNLGLEFVLAFFMVVTATNYVLLYRFLQRRYDVFAKDSERKWFYGVIAVLSGLVVISLLVNHTYDGLFQTIRYGLFQTISILSTSGVASIDYTNWPPMAHMLLFYAALIGGCSGSTAGGIKISRLVVLLKICLLEVKRVLHPKMVASIVMSGRPVAQNTIIGVTRYLFAYVLMMGILTALYSLTGTDMIEAISTVVVFLNNVGPAYTVLGETTDFQHMTNFGYIVLYFTMIIGRIEIVSFVILLHPDFWKQHKGW